jgi:hypothetical protein
VIPARVIAARTASATLVTIAVRPMSSGSSCSLIANPTVSRGSSLGSASVVAKIVACGLSTPSVPPDQTTGTSLTLAGSAPFSTRTSRNARSAMIRV